MDDEMSNTKVITPAGFDWTLRTFGLMDQVALLALSIVLLIVIMNIH